MGPSGLSSQSNHWTFISLGYNSSLVRGEMVYDAPYLKIKLFQGCGRRNMDEPLGNNLDCYVDMPNIPFRTGRTDCESGSKPYIGKKILIHQHLRIINKLQNDI